MDRKTAWLLNFDADEELARPSGYTLSPEARARFETLAPHVRALLRPGDVVLAEGKFIEFSSNFIGRAWCPTPRAQKALLRAGVTVAPAPPLAVLRAANHRRFNASLGQTLPGARYALTLDDVTAALAAPSPTGRWLLKRPFGFAGRGRLPIDLAKPGDLDRAQPWIRASLRAGDGLQVEPFVDRLGDFALHGHLAPSGELVLGEPTCQECDPRGAWIGSSRADRSALSTAERDQLFEHAHLAAAALQNTGYFGPFGIDAFLFRGEGGQLAFNPRCEINARYSMGWAVGMGDVRPDIEDPEGAPIPASGAG
jgi:hypothetical protein